MFSPSVRRPVEDAGSVFRGGGIPAGGYQSGAEVKGDTGTAPQSDLETPSHAGGNVSAPDPKIAPDPSPPSGTPSHAGGNVGVPEISLPEFTPGTGINKDKSGNGADAGSEANMKEKNKTADAAGREVQAMMQAQGSASNSPNPWYDPRSWLTSGTGGSQSPPRSVILLGGAVIAAYLFS